MSSFLCRAKGLLISLFMLAVQVSSAQSAREQKLGAFFGPEDIAGLIRYDSLEASRKIGIDASTEFYPQFCRLLSSHNARVRELVRENEELFASLETMKSKHVKIAAERYDFQPIMELIDVMKNQLHPVSIRAKEDEDYLNTLMLPILGERKHKRWLNYQAKLKKSKMPKYPMPMAGPLPGDY